MNNDIKNSFKESFLHQPSGEFTNIVEQKIAQLQTAPKPEKSNHWMLVVVLFFMIGLPLFVVLFALFSQIQFPDFQPFAALSLDNSWLLNFTRFFTDFLPYFMYLLVFMSVYFLGRLLQTRHVRFSA